MKEGKRGKAGGTAAAAGVLRTCALLLWNVTSYSRHLSQEMKTHTHGEKSGTGGYKGSPDPPPPSKRLAPAAAQKAPVTGRFMFALRVWRLVSGCKHCSFGSHVQEMYCEEKGHNMIHWLPPAPKVNSLCL